ncbi:MAG: MlaD family protein [Sphingomonadaceae bacterium]|nr:MlaD family protein [Sphingomonadaceae bacterium]
METRSSYVLVGAVAVALSIALFAFILWLARFDGGAVKKQYDILFPSVGGLATGSQVQFQGVPVGAVQSIHLVPERPNVIRVRIQVNGDTPVLMGTRATVSGVGFTGVSVVELDGAMAGQAPIDAPGPWGKPLIPTKPGALAGLLESAPQLLNNASRLVDNLNEVLNEENQRKLSVLLDNLNRDTDQLAQQGPELKRTLQQAQVALQKTGAAADKVGTLADTTSETINRDGSGLVAELKQTSRTANATLKELGATAAAARPAMETLNRQTLPEANGLLRDLRGTNQSLGAVAGKLDEDPLGALVGGRSLPDYKPPKARK